MKELRAPLKKKDVLSLKAGDIVFISGNVITARDAAHQKMLKSKHIPFSANVIFHAGPVTRKTKRGFEVTAIGPTTSARMNSLAPEVVERFHVRAVIGKGGMGRKVLNALHGKAVYFAFTGGCAASGAAQVKKVNSVHWPELGAPESVWSLEVEKLGPLVVAMDAHGRDLFQKVRKLAQKKKKKLVK